MGSNLSQWDRKRPTYTIPVSSLLAPPLYPFAALFFSSTISLRPCYTVPFSCRKGTHSQLAFSLLPVRRGLFASPSPCLFLFSQAGGGRIPWWGESPLPSTSIFKVFFQLQAPSTSSLLQHFRILPFTHSLFKPF